MKRTSIYAAPGERSCGSSFDSKNNIIDKSQYLLSLPLDENHNVGMKWNSGQW